MTNIDSMVLIKIINIVELQVYIKHSYGIKD